MNYDQRKDRIVEAYKKAKEERLRLQEREKVCLEDMKKSFNVDNAAELKTLIESTQKKIDKLKDKIEPALDKLEEALNL